MAANIGNSSLRECIAGAGRAMGGSTLLKRRGGVTPSVDIELPTREVKLR